MFDCPVPRWISAPLSINQTSELEVLKKSYEFVSADLVVLTQACDLEQDKVTNVTLCPHLSLTEFKNGWEEETRESGNNPTPKYWKRVCEDLNKGYIWNQTLINKSELEEFIMDYRVVDFYDVFTLPKIFLESLLTKRNQQRIRLLPPYREHLSQAFARFFMRVGLPTNIALSDLTAITSKTTDDNQA